MMTILERYIFVILSRFVRRKKIIDIIFKLKFQKNRSNEEY